MQSFGLDWADAAKLLSLALAQQSLAGSGNKVARSDPEASGPDTVVVARVYTRELDRVRHLRDKHDLWFYLWKKGYAVIRADRDDLPPDAIIDAEKTARLQAPPRAVLGDTIPGFECYRTVETTHADLSQLAADNPDLAEWVDYGDSWEKTDGQGGYDLQALVLTNENIAGPKPVLMVMAAMHARELTTAEIATRFAEHLLDGYGVDGDATWLLDHNEIHILPQHNPDGRKQAEAGLSWRKNTNQNYCGATSNSRGADLNRNASGMFWNGSSSSGSQCAPTYRGPTPASEPESAAIEQYMAEHFPDQRGDNMDDPAPPDAEGVFISIHSVAEIVFYPWEGDDIAPPNLTGLRALAQRMGFITDYAACQNCVLGPASGTTVDHAYEFYGVASFTYETGIDDFFEECSDFEADIWPENRDALVYAAKSTRRPYMTSLGPDVLALDATISPTQITITATADDTGYTANTSGEPMQTSHDIAKVQYTLDLPPWETDSQFPLQPADGAFNGPVEEIDATLDPGPFFDRRLIFVFAADADGNTGPPTAVFIESSEAILTDGFE